MTTELWTAAPTQLMHDQTQLYLINDFTPVWTRAPIWPHFLFYTVTNYSYWLNRVCQNSLCPDLCERISTILSWFEVTQLFFLYFSICIYSYSVPISTEEEETSPEGQPLCFTSSTSSRLFSHSFLPFQKGHSTPPENNQLTSKSNETSHLICWFQNSKNMHQKEFCRAQDFQLNQKDWFVLKQTGPTLLKKQKELKKRIYYLFLEKNI